MLRKLNFLFLTFLFTVGYSVAQSGLGTLKGVVKDEVSKEPIFNATVVLKQGDAIKNRVKTDDQGKFQMNSIAPGQYDVELKNEVEGYLTALTTGVIISGDKITFLDDLTMGKPGVKKEADGVLAVQEVVVKAYKVPLISKDNTASGGTMTREDISKLPARNAAAVAQTVGGVGTNEGNGDISIRGSRSDDTYFYIDGIKVRGSSNLPKSAIEEVSVITGGLPANYGDATGGIISVTTRGPSAKFFGSVEAVSSGFYIKGADVNGYDGKVYGLDKYAYNLAEGMLSGPLLMQRDSLGRKTRPLLGFLVSFNYTDELDGRPLANGGGFRIKKDVRDYLLANPLRQMPEGKAPISNAMFLRSDDFERNPWRMNARSTVISSSAKIDVRTGPSMNLTFGGSLNLRNGKQYSYSNSLLNFSNFGSSYDLDWRVYGRLSQRFVNNQPGSSSLIKSAYYTLMVDYSEQERQLYDEKHGFNLFDYGYVGKFKTTQERQYKGISNGIMEQDGVPRDVRVDFEPSQKNAALAAITTQYYSIFQNNPQGHYENIDQVQAGNALINGQLPTNIYSIWSNIGSPYNSVFKAENDQFRVTGAGSLNIGDHAISLGFEYEKRTDRGYSFGNGRQDDPYGPIGLWKLARSKANFHLKELDVKNGDTTNMGGYSIVNYERLNSGYAYKNNGEYGGQLNKDEQSFFDYNLRTKLGLSGGSSNYIDVFSLDPSLLKIDMFSPDELLNSGDSYINYYGYDIAGNKVSGTTNINDYFTKYDEKTKNYERKVGAFQPIYVAGYLMDKFAFNDLVFNVGVRVDVFDANQPVLKDPYLFYSAKTVNEVLNDKNLPFKADVPSNIGGDYTVYVDDIKNPTKINGYRLENNWYDAKGAVVEDPKVLRGAAGIAPYLQNPDQKTLSSDAFTTYKPQINVMPRVAFSFPISDEASFFAHYDILTKRPTSGARFDPTQYQFIQQNASPTINNPNLKPETTIDYELGFQQVLTPTSSLKISAFYREQRNNVQLINVFDAYPNSYKTYGNRDFGTVKGLTIAYDLRRTGNVRLTANYTLQFAEGTGSDATSASAFINAGLPNLRNIFPYNFDTRHQFNIVLDYRYGEGKDYNGPMLGNIALFENTGLNLMTNIYSGSPYSSKTNIVNEGSLSPSYSGLTGTLNGSRNPWAYRLDLQVDKTINIAFNQKDGKKKVTFLNVYVRATNLLNQFNVINVYRATGNWNDDGYLAAAEFQTTIQNQIDEQSFRDYYNMKIQNSYNISSPRTIRLGIKFDF